ncbi:MAG: hypothetical protein HY023_07525 [Chloroflexi bacterium]|nr:hypothetical protein [Chloroflexota bacterium]
MSRRDQADGMLSFGDDQRAALTASGFVERDVGAHRRLLDALGRLQPRQVFERHIGQAHAGLSVGKQHIVERGRSPRAVGFVDDQMPPALALSGVQRRHGLPEGRVPRRHQISADELIF